MITSPKIVITTASATVDFGIVMYGADEGLGVCTSTVEELEASAWGKRGAIKRAPRLCPEVIGILFDFSKELWTEKNERTKGRET